MNPRITEKEWLEDFKDFVSTKEVTVPEEISKRVLERVHRDLNPSPWIVFLKLLGIHSVVGTLSLAICDQFGVNPFNSGFSLSEYFMKFGHSFCMVLCGFLFLGLTGIFCQVILRREEFLILKKNVFIQIFFLSVLSVVSLLAFGAQIFFGTILLWLIGALLGGIITVQFLSFRMQTT